MIIYVCYKSWDYEGGDVDGVYPSAKAAREHRWTGGDRHDIQRWRVTKQGCHQLADLAITTRRRSRKKV